MSNAPEEPEDEDPSEDTVAIAARAAAAIGGAFALAGLAFYGPRAAFSVLVGASIAVANILTMRVIIRSLVPAHADDESPHVSRDPAASDPDHPPPEPEQSGRRGGVMWGVFAALKMLILFGGIWILLTRHVVDPIPLLVGYGAMPLGIVAGALWPSFGKRS